MASASATREIKRRLERSTRMNLGIAEAAWANSAVGGRRPDSRYLSIDSMDKASWMGALEATIEDRLSWIAGDKPNMRIQLEDPG